MTLVTTPPLQQNQSQSQMPMPLPENGWQNPPQMPAPSTQKDSGQLPPAPHTQGQQQRWQPQMQPQPADLAAISAQYQASLYARCASGDHQAKTAYGLFGIITAVVCFPCGLICLFTDSHKECSRCGVSLG